MKRIRETRKNRSNRRLRSFGRVDFVVWALFCIGCGDFFEKQSTEIESLRVLKELSEVRESKEVSNPLPDLYKQPPSRLEIKDGVKVFYFTQNHPAKHLGTLVGQQLGVKPVPHDATNQLVVHCKNHEQADSVLSYLELVDVPPVQVNIDCLILERFGDVTMDWETSVFMENFLGEDLTLGEKLATFYYKDGTEEYTLKNGQLAPLNRMNYPGVPFDTFVGGELLDLDPAFPGASLRETERANFGADFGYWMDQWVPGHQVRTIVDVLVSRGYLKILINPTLETVNGQKAMVTIQDYTPIEKVQTGQGGASDAYNITEYVWVKDTLTVTPHVYADGMIGLQTSIIMGSRSKPEGVVQRSIITERSIDVAENRISPGESLVIGGMRKSEKRSVIRGVPFFKDLPILGILFSSKDFEEKGTEIIFILTPSISSGGREHSEVVDEIRKKHEKPKYELGLDKMLTDPLGEGPYTEVVEKEAAETEVARLKAEAERDQAMEVLDEEKRKTAEAEKQAELLRKQAAELEKQARQAQVETKKAFDAAAAAQNQRQAEQAKADELSQQAQKTHQEAQRLQAEAQEAARQAAEAEKRAQQQAERARKAQQSAAQSQKELEKTKKQVESKSPQDKPKTTE